MNSKDPCKDPCKNPCKDPCSECSKIKVKCTSAYRLNLKQEINHSDSAEVIDAFNKNDGDAPYTVISADFVGIQHAIYNLEILPRDNERYQITGLIKPYLIVNYKDGTGVTRSKLLPVEVNIDHTAYISAPMDNIDVYSILESSSADNLNYDEALNKLSLRYELQSDLYVIKHEPEKFAVLGNDDYCKCFKTQKYSVLKINTVCNAETEVSFSSTTVPFKAIGTEPYTISDFKFLPVKPNLLTVTENKSNIALSLSFPVEFTLTSSDQEESKQESALFATVIINNYTVLGDSQFLLSLVPSLIGQPMVSKNVIRASLSIKGVVSNVETPPCKIRTVNFVECGPVALCNCDVSGTPPTIR